MRPQVGSFCLVATGIFIVAEILLLYAGFKYSYRRGLDNILVLLIGGIPIAMPTQLAKHKAMVTRITAIEELAGADNLTYRYAHVLPYLLLIYA
ncbi:hypothetical protein C8R44DRAFT_881086 [Mycena epipterygia]|nr:hypothetical protein C8R44DRAFT_881086 [Mycena epipterygia]